MTAKCDYPTLKTVMAIEDAIRKADSVMTRKKILSMLPTKTTRSNLNAALDYLEKRGLILDTKKGFIWIYNDNPRLRKAIAEGLEL